MKVLRFGRVLAATLALAACSEDPTQSGTGQAHYIEASSTTTFQEAGRPFSLSTWVRDSRGNRLAEPVTAVANDAGIRVDSSIYHRETSETRIFITPLLLDTTAFLTVSGGGLISTIYVKSLPAALRLTLPSFLPSGFTAHAIVDALDAQGNVIAANVSYRVTSSDTTKIKANPSGSFTARSPGLVTLTFTGPGGKITKTGDILVVPLPFSH